MNNEHKMQSRKKFISVGITSGALLTAIRFFNPVKKHKTETIKMLTQDGKLVEVDKTRLLEWRRKNITDEQLKNWVARK